LVTMILSEDVRARTAFASETTKFLDRDVQRLETQLSQFDAQIAELRRRPGGVAFDPSRFDEGRSLAALKAELVIRGANLASSHPEIRALKQKIAALENTPKSESTDTDAAAGSTPTNEPGFDALETKRASIKAELNTATQRLAAARLGENLERGQHSERLQVLEQPTLPQKPTSPNRPRIFIIAFMAALMAGGGLAFATELSDQSVRRSSDLYSIIDSHLIVSIPYIATRGEARRKKTKTISGSAIVAALIVASLIALFFILPPLDIVFTKLMTTVLK
ncbi:MAG: sugar transporter, partial [Pseudolabrys sp.]